jgi:hypothetical protein
VFVQKNNQYSVECHTKVSGDCFLNGEYFDSEEEATDWVEEECWIFSGEGWFCTNCNRHFMQSLSKVRRTKGQEEKEDNPGNELIIGIDPL